MVEISDEDFEKVLASALDSMDDASIKAMNNVAIVWAFDPTPEQRRKQHLDPHQTLFGLYEGIPITNRSINYSGVLPDKITIFKNPLMTYSDTPEQLLDHIKATLLHEIAHHFGMDHERIHTLENSRQKKRRKSQV